VEQSAVKHTIRNSQHRFVNWKA